MVGNDAQPTSTSQTVYFSFIVVLGAICISVFFGNIAAVMGNMNRKENLFQEKVDLISMTMKNIILPEAIQAQVLNYLLQVQSGSEVNQDMNKLFQS